MGGGLGGGHRAKTREDNRDQGGTECARSQGRADGGRIQGRTLSRRARMQAQGRVEGERSHREGLAAGPRETTDQDGDVRGDSGGAVGRGDDEGPGGQGGATVTSNQGGARALED